MIDKTHEVHKEIRQVVRSPFNVVLEGESGVGKGHFAKLIHQERNRGGEFVVHDCEGMVQEQTRIVEHLTSPIFLERLQQSGRRDTFFLRRIDLLQAHMLAQLSDFFEELGKRGEISRRELLSCRLIGSLQTTMAKEPTYSIQLLKFLNSLFCLKIRIPPLRDRKREIPHLIRKFIDLFNTEQKRSVSGVSRDVLGLLLQHNWPDNVRELKMEIERAATLTSDYQTIKPITLSYKLLECVSKAPSLP